MRAPRVDDGMTARELDADDFEIDSDFKKEYEADLELIREED